MHPYLLANESYPRMQERATDEVCVQLQELAPILVGSELPARTCVLGNDLKCNLRKIERALKSGFTTFATAPFLSSKPVLF